MASMNTIYVNTKSQGRILCSKHMTELQKRASERSSCFFKCRYTIRLWKMVIEKFQLTHLDTSSWHLEASVKSWWENLTGTGVPDRKAMASMTMLVSWTVWNERNARVFRHKCAPPAILLAFIVNEAKLWVTAGAKKLGAIILRE